MTDDEEIAVKKRQFEKFLRDRGFLVTSQRLAITDAALRSGGPFHADATLKRAREYDRSISLSTVHRTLHLLTESGLVGVLGSRKDFKFYDPNYSKHPNHHHIICNDCDKIVEFESKDIEQLESEISHKLGFTIGSQKIEIRGYCEDLKKKANKKKELKSK